jgi:hypothetical protein
MQYWVFRDYVTQRGNCPIREWYDAQIPEVQGFFDQLVRDLAALSRWPTSGKFIEELRKTHKGLWTLRFKLDEDDDDKKYRPAGIVTRPPGGQFGQGEFVFLLGCHKRWGVYTPPYAFCTALSLRQQYYDNEGTTYVHNID